MGGSAAGWAAIVAGCGGSNAGSPALPAAFEAGPGAQEAGRGQGSDAAPVAPGPGPGGDATAGGSDAEAMADGLAQDAGVVPPSAQDAGGGVPGADAGLALEGGSTAPNPFRCKFGWGRDSSGSASGYGSLQFLSSWVGSEVKADGSITACNACGWLSGQLANTNLIPAFYAYFIGFYGHANGLADGNQTPNAPNLTTGGSALIKANRTKIVQMYSWYAQQTARAWPTKPLIWLLEGDFVQYVASSQTSPLSYAELGQLAADITTAIKSQMPNAVVAIDHSTWSSDAVTKSFWAAMAAANYDLVWTTGVGNNNGFFDATEKSTTYNAATATYAYVHALTGRKIFVDESAGLSQASDTWSNQPAATINSRIAEGVIAANVTGAPSNYQANVTALQSQLSTTCP